MFSSLHGIWQNSRWRAAAILKNILKNGLLTKLTFGTGGQLFTHKISHGYLKRFKIGSQLTNVKMAAIRHLGFLIVLLFPRVSTLELTGQDSTGQNLSETIKKLYNKRDATRVS